MLLITDDRIGRNNIFTDVEEINDTNIIEILRQAFIEHISNSDKCDFLLKYEAGEQPITREKTYRPEIDTKCIDNVANEITEFKLGFKWGCPITLIQRGESDSGSDKEAEAISLLNEQYETVGARAKTQELARYIEICGIGYTYIDVNTDWTDGDAYFNLDVLDPRYAFVVKSNRIGHKPVLGVTYSRDSKGNTFFTCFTRDRRYEIENLVKIVNADTGSEKTVDQWNQRRRSGERNPLGMIPIIEWIRSYDRMGCFERQIPDMDALNILESDMVNASSEQVDCIWHCNDVDFPEDESGNTEHPQTGDWLQTYTSKDGKTPFVTALSPNYDYSGNLNNVMSKRSLILQKCNVPQRNDNSGGSTGIAMSDATGWSSAEASACKDEQIMSLCKMNEVKAVLKAISISPDIKRNNPMLKLKYSDMMPSIKRQKTYELTNKANAIVTLLNAGFDGYHVLKNIPFFSDPNQAWEDSKTMVKKIQESKVTKKESTENKEQDNNIPHNNPNDPNNQNPADVEKPNPDRITQDNSDQTDNSPNLDK